MPRVVREALYLDCIRKPFLQVVIPNWSPKISITNNECELLKILPVSIFCIVITVYYLQIACHPGEITILSWVSHRKYKHFSTSTSSEIRKKTTLFNTLRWQLDGLVQDYNNPSASALVLVQSCTRTSNYITLTGSIKMLQHCGSVIIPSHANMATHMIYFPHPDVYLWYELNACLTKSTSRPFSA